MKKIAIFLNKDKLDIFTRYTIHIIIFNVINESIRDINNEFLAKKDINYISLWLLRANIEEIYVQDVDQQAMQYFGSIGISVKKHDDMKINPLFNVNN